MSLSEMFTMSVNTNAIGTVIMVALLATCIVGCTLVVIDTVRDTIQSVRGMLKERKNKKTKN